MDRKTDKLSHIWKKPSTLTAQMQTGENAPAFPNYLPRVRRC